MQISGQLIKILETETGVSKSGTKREKQQFVVKTDGQYPKDVCFQNMGKSYNVRTFKIGDQLDVSFDAESREYNGKYFTNLTAWKVQLSEQKNNEPKQADLSNLDDSSDLPF